MNRRLGRVGHGADRQVVDPVVVDVAHGSEGVPEEVAALSVGISEVEEPTPILTQKT